jgi:hypothetical protein
MLALFLVLQVFGACRALHHWLHPDSDSPDHRCVMRLVSQGQIEQAPIEVTLPLTPTVAASVVFPDSFVLVAIEYRLLPGRAPPSRLT